MLGVTAFALMGLLSGALTGWAFFAFGDRKVKFGSGAISIALVSVETYLALKFVLPENHEPSTLIFTLIVSNVVSFFGAILLLSIVLKLAREQQGPFAITVIDVIFNNNKALTVYHDSRKDEIDRRLKAELNVEALEKTKLELDARSKELAEKEASLKCEVDEAKDLLDQRDEFFDSKFSITIPQKYKHGIRTEFFDLLPRHVMKVGVFYSRLRPLTEQFLSKKPRSINPDEFFESYLLGVANYIRICLFDQNSNTGENEVRVHFRVFDKASLTYKAKPSLIACDTIQPITDLSVHDGLIASSLASKRSLVYTANRKEAKNTGSGHLWQDYLTYCFEKIQEDGYPKYTFGISVKHKAAHSSFLYFLSYIQIEQIIQQDMIKLNNYLAKFNAEKAA